MKMLMIIGPPGRREEIRELIGRHGVHAYSEFASVAGEGATGRRLGTHVFPDTSALIFTVVPADKKDELLAALRDFSAGLFAAEGLRAFVLPVEEMI